MPFPSPDLPIPSITTEQMIEVDRLMIEVYHIELIQMMENAGRCLALVAKEQFLQGNPRGKQIVILAGTGGNGGGALVAGRRLKTWGTEVSVCITHPARMTPIPAHQLDILHRMKIPIVSLDTLKKKKEVVDLILDGIIGYSLSGAPRGIARDMIHWANAQKASTLSLDTPSGISLTTGQQYDPTIKAEATLTLALPKVGLFHEKILPFRGTLLLGDISVPPELYASPSLQLKVGPLFARSDILSLI
ncbi:MAG: NAD(P)H-hydrate epimerase [Bacteroidota bacterium]